MPMKVLRCQSAILIIICLAAAAASAFAQPAPAANAATGADVKPFKPEELEQIVAPIALYPDALLAQCFMASTYPLEVVQADRWVAENKDLKADALTAALEKKDWDPSVKSLVDFPQVLTMMSTQLDWTAKLGDAFIADQAAVMAAVQRLRAKARAEGNLKDTPEQKVIVEQSPPQSIVVQAPPPQVITIESASPSVVYVPTYNPEVVYGPWPYPAYPPYPPYYPPGYVVSNAVSFGAGVAVGFAWGYAWGHCDWRHGNLDVDVNRNANFNRNIDRDRYRQDIQNRNVNRDGQNTFQHDPAHRKGVSYRDQATANKYRDPGTMNAAMARQNYRGFADAGRQDLARGGADPFRGSTPGRGPGTVSPRPDAGRLDGGRAGPPANRVAPSPGPRPGPVQNYGSAFSGANRPGPAVRADANRGMASRGAPPPMPRGGGGAMRGGGRR